MRSDQSFLDAMREATRVLRTEGPQAATRLIKDALRSRTPTTSTTAEQGDVEVLDPAEQADVEVLDPAERTPQRADLDVIDVPFREVSDVGAPPIDSPRDHDDTLVIEPAVAAKELVMREARGAFERKRFSADVGARGYKLYVPASYIGEPMPLVVLLHGCTQDANAFAIGTRANQWAEGAGCIVAYPEQMRRANTNRCWNWFRPQDQQRGSGEPALIAAIVDHIASDVMFDRRRVYVAGLSAGGAMAAVLGRAYPDIFAAVGVHSGLTAGAAHNVRSALAAMRSGSDAMSLAPQARPLIVIHGDADRTVHPSNGEGLVDAARASYAQEGISLRLEAHDAPASAIEYAHRRTRYVDPDGKAMIEQWQLHGLGHAWAGGNADASHVDARGPDSTRGMFSFFAQHALPLIAAEQT